MSINLTQALGAGGANPCFNFGSVWLHTYNGNSISSIMADYVKPAVAARRLLVRGQRRQEGRRQPGLGATRRPTRRDYHEGTPADPSSAQVGDYLWYRLAVTNSGTASLTPSVTDANCDLAGQPDADREAEQPRTSPTRRRRTFDAGDVWTYLCKHQLAAGDPEPYVNTVKAKGTRGSFTTPEVAGQREHDAATARWWSRRTSPARSRPPTASTCSSAASSRRRASVTAASTPGADRRRRRVGELRRGLHGRRRVAVRQQRGLRRHQGHGRHRRRHAGQLDVRRRHAFRQRHGRRAARRSSARSPTRAGRARSRSSRTSSRARTRAASTSASTASLATWRAVLGPARRTSPTTSPSAAITVADGRIAQRRGGRLGQPGDEPRGLRLERLVQQERRRLHRRRRRRRRSARSRSPTATRSSARSSTPARAR